MNTFAQLPADRIASTLSILDINILVSEEPIERDGSRWEKIDDALVEIAPAGTQNRYSFRAASNAVMAADAPFSFDGMEWE